MIIKIPLKTNSRNEMIDITSLIEKEIKDVKEGTVTIFSPHTTAAITIQENADLDVQTDLLRKLDEIAKDNNYLHAEGNSDSHLKTLLTGASETIIVKDGNLILGTWQSIFFCEFDGPRKRNIILKSHI